MNYLDVIEVISKMENKMTYIKLMTHTRKYKQMISREISEDVS